MSSTGALAALQPKQRAFLEAYVQCWNATEAARKAKYKHPNKQGPALLVNLGVRAALKEILEGTQMQPEELRGRVEARAKADMGDFLRIDQRGVSFDLRKAKARGKLFLLKKLEIKEGRVTKLEICDPLAAQHLVGQHLGLWDGDGKKMDELPPDPTETPADGADL